MVGDKPVSLISVFHMLIGARKFAFHQLYTNLFFDCELVIDDKSLKL